MRNPHIDLALVLLQRQRREQDDRTLGEHLLDAHLCMARTNSAITYLETL